MLSCAPDCVCVVAAAAGCEGYDNEKSGRIHEARGDTKGDNRRASTGKKWHGHGRGRRVSCEVSCGVYGGVFLQASMRIMLLVL